MNKILQRGLLSLCLIALFGIISYGQAEPKPKKLTYDEVVKLRQEYINKKKAAVRAKIKARTEMTIEELKALLLSNLQTEENSLSDQGVLNSTVQNHINARKDKINSMTEGEN